MRQEVSGGCREEERGRGEEKWRWLRAGQGGFGGLFMEAARVRANFEGVLSLS